MTGVRKKNCLRVSISGHWVYQLGKFDLLEGNGLNQQVWWFGSEKQIQTVQAYFYINKILI